MSALLKWALRRGEAATDLIGRALLVSLFLVEGRDKIANYSGALAYMALHEVPGAILPAAIAIEIGASLLILVGWQTRIAALALACFSAAAAILFHFGSPVRNELLHFEKDLALAGAFLVVAARGAGRLSLDALRFGRPSRHGAFQDRDFRQHAAEFVPGARKMLDPTGREWPT